MDNRKIDIEFMRILACFFVIFNHTGNQGFFLFSLYGRQEPQFWIYMFVSVFCKFAVPVFFSISGALLLGKTSESIKELYCHRIWKMGMLLLLWSFFNYFLQIIQGNQIFNVKEFLKRVYESNWNGSYWYLYAYLSMLITLPILQSLAQNMKNSTFVYMFAMVFLFSSVIPALQCLLWQGRHDLNGYLKIGWLCGNTVLYPLLGYFLYNRISALVNKNWTQI